MQCFPLGNYLLYEFLMFYLEFLKKPRISLIKQKRKKPSITFCFFSSETNMKSILADVIGMVATSVACVVVFCGLQCIVLSTYFYEAIRGSDS